MPKPLQQVLDDADADLDLVRSFIETGQADKFLERVRYVQTPWLCSADPVDGGLSSTDQKDLKVSDEAYTWTDLGFPIPPNVRYNAQLHVYEAPEPVGWGWLVILRLLYTTQTWMRVEDFGTAGRTKAWYEYVEEV